MAGDLAKVQPLLQRLHILEKPKKRHRLRNVILVGSVLGALAIVVAVARGRRGCRDNTAGAGKGFEQSGSAGPEAPPTELE